MPVHAYICHLHGLEYIEKNIFCRNLDILTLHSVDMYFNCSNWYMPHSFYFCSASNESNKVTRVCCTANLFSYSCEFPILFTQNCSRKFFFFIFFPTFSLMYASDFLGNYLVNWTTNTCYRLMYQMCQFVWTKFNKWKFFFLGIE